MPYAANQYNYATPLSGAAGLISEVYTAPSAKLFTLHDNVLDGTYFPISGDVGLWGNSLSDSDGTLPNPFVVTVTENLVLNAYRLVSDPYSYPVAFTVKFYNGSTLLYTITETANDQSTYIAYLPRTFNVTSYVLTITKLSATNSVARVHNTYNLGYVKRADVAAARVHETNIRADVQTLMRSDVLRIEAVDTPSHILNTIDLTHDSLAIDSVDSYRLTNIHSVMKSPFRKVYSKVLITYTDPMLSGETRVEYGSSAYNSQPLQVIDGDTEVTGRYFTLYDNDLSGNYTPSDERSQVGWVSDAVSDSNGNFDEPQVLRITFPNRPINNFKIYFDDSHGSVPKDFNVAFVEGESGQVVHAVHFTENLSREVSVSGDATFDISEVLIEILSTTLPGHPAAIVEVPMASTFLYKGYKDESDLISIDMLEELTYKDDVEALGGVSANEVTVVLDNSNRDFYFNSGSPIARHLRRNRKIVPYLGAEVVPGEIEWHCLGTYWSHNWTVPVNGLTATVVGFDTLGLLDTTDFSNHTVLIDKSLGRGIEYILEDAKRTLGFIEYRIAPELYELYVPYMWFEHGSHTNAIRKISDCYPMHVYCDRDGIINAAPQKLRLDYYYDVWSDSTNVVGKTYDSLYTTLPNIINVAVVHPALVADDVLINDTTIFDVSVVNNRVLNFGKPYVSDFAITIDKDSAVSYDYTVYSWGAEINFYGTGKVRSIECKGTALDTSSTTSMTSRDTQSIRFNGAVARDVSSDFIQTDEHAALIIDRLRSLSELDKYDASVDYRGDISLTINDPIRLLNGIAPDDRYNIKRHQLYWDGALSGSADLNT